MVHPTGVHMRKHLIQTWFQAQLRIKIIWYSLRYNSARYFSHRLFLKSYLQFLTKHTGVIRKLSGKER